MYSICFLFGIALGALLLDMFVQWITNKKKERITMYKIEFGGSPQGANPVIHKMSIHDGPIEFGSMDGNLAMAFGVEKEIIYVYTDGQWSQPNDRVGYTDITITFTEGDPRQ